MSLAWLAFVPLVIAVLSLGYGYGRHIRSLEELEKARAREIEQLATFPVLVRRVETLELGMAATAAELVRMRELAGSRHEEIRDAIAEVRADLRVVESRRVAVAHIPRGRNGE